MHVENVLLPHMQWLIRKRVWKYTELPVDTKNERILIELRDYGWIDLRLVGSERGTDWTQDCDLPEWIGAANGEGIAILEIRVSKRGLSRLDELTILEREERERFGLVVSKPSQSPQIHPARHAMAILLEEPEISPTELANLVGVSRGTLYKSSPKWIGVRRTLMAREPDRVMKGTKGSDYPLEAEDEFRELHPTDDDTD